MTSLLFIYYFILDTIQDIFSKLTMNCIRAHPHVLPFLILHHFLSGFLLGGWLFNYKPILFLHILVVIGIIIYWRNNNNRCELTIYVNKQCGWNHDKPFNDLLNLIGLKKMKDWNEYYHYLFILLGASISIYKIYVYK